jgi:hypothetical protein
VAYSPINLLLKEKKEMDDIERVTTECVQRINNFGTENAAAVVANAVAVAAFADIGNYVAQLDETGALRTSAGITKLTQTGFRRMKRTELTGFLIRMSGIARDKAKNDPNFVNKFRLDPDNRNDSLLLESARAFHAESAAVKEIFVGYGLPGNFRTTLQTLIDEFDGAINAQDTAKRGRIDANATIDDIIDRALSGRRTLLVIIPNIFAGNPGKLADWASASHIEKLPRSNPAPTTPTP